MVYYFKSNIIQHINRLKDRERERDFSMEAEKALEKIYYSFMIKKKFS